jgi:NADPH:quinone reductase-like Zn-dependent oxidoreductase
MPAGTITAATYHRYGAPSVVALEPRPAPICGPKDLLIDVHFTTVSSGDARVRAMRAPRGFGLIIRLVFGIFRPRKPVLGTELSGIVAHVGAQVTTFKPGDAVVAFTGTRMGAHATQVVVPEGSAIVMAPANVPLDVAAAMSFGGTTALHFLRDKAKLQAGESVLVIGASGAVGSAAVQMAHAMGAQVTGVCSGKNTALVESLGAQAIDYRNVDVTRLPDRYDVIFDTTGHVSFASHQHLLTAKGRMVLIAADLPQMLGAARSTGRAIVGTAWESRDLLQAVSDMVSAGTFTPHIGHRFPFSGIAAAHARVDTGHKRGSVVVVVDPAQTAALTPETATP